MGPNIINLVVRYVDLRNSTLYACGIGNWTLAHTINLMVNTLQILLQLLFMYGVQGKAGTNKIRIIT